MLVDAEGVQLGGLDTMAELSDADVVALIGQVTEHDAILTMDVQSGALADANAGCSQRCPGSMCSSRTSNRPSHWSGRESRKPLRHDCSRPAASSRADDGCGRRSISVPTRPGHSAAMAVEVVDTTGCGDAFAADGLLGRVGLVRGLGVAQVLRYATAAATLVAGGLGSAAGLRGWAHPDGLLASR